MALVPANNDAFFREVDDELRRDRAQRVWKRWGLWIVAGVVAALVAFGGWLYWQHRQREAAGVEGERLQVAFDGLAAGNTAATTAPLSELVRSDNDGYRALALFTQADILLQKNDLKGAAAKFATVAADTGLAQPFRDLALIRQTAAEFDTVKPQVVVDRLRALTVPGSTWLGSAGELVGAAYIKMGKRAEAGEIFGRIVRDKEVPDSLRQRAIQLSGVLGGASQGQTRGQTK